MQSESTCLQVAFGFLLVVFLYPSILHLEQASDSPV